MPSTSTRVLGLMVLHEKQIRSTTEMPTLFEIRALRSRALQEITNSGIRQRLGRLGLELIVEPDAPPAEEPTLPVEEPTA